MRTPPVTVTATHLDAYVFVVECSLCGPVGIFPLPPDTTPLNDHVTAHITTH